VLLQFDCGPFDRTFQRGDVAERDSYNLHYTGTIVSIGPKTVTIKGDDETSRLTFGEFISRNWNFDAEKIAAQNAAWQD
jgi:hypothetical protein